MVQQAFFDLVDSAVDAEDDSQNVFMRLVFRGKQIFELPIEEFLRTVPQNATQCFIHPMQPSVGCNLDHANARMLVQRAQQGWTFRFSQTVIHVRFGQRVALCKLKNTFN